MPKLKSSAEIEWRLPAHVKAEILAGVFHQLSDHMPKVWKKVPAWLRAQIKQAMLDCSVDFKDFTPAELGLSANYCAWLAEKYPQPGSTLAVLKRKRRVL